MQYQLNLPAPYERGTTLSGSERKVLSASIERTNAAVLDAVRSLGGATAFEVHDRVGGLLTSVRRSLTDLFNAGVLVKDGKKMGKYGVRVSVYKLK